MKLKLVKINMLVYIIVFQVGNILYIICETKNVEVQHSSIVF